MTHWIRVTVLGILCLGTAACVHPRPLPLPDPAFKACIGYAGATDAEYRAGTA